VTACDRCSNSLPLSVAVSRFWVTLSGTERQQTSYQCCVQCCEVGTVLIHDERDRETSVVNAQHTAAQLSRLQSLGQSLHGAAVSRDLVSQSYGARRRGAARYCAPWSTTSISICCRYRQWMRSRRLTMTTRWTVMMHAVTRRRWSPVQCRRQRHVMTGRRVLVWRSRWQSRQTPASSRTRTSTLNWRNSTATLLDDVVTSTCFITARSLCLPPSLSFILYVSLWLRVCVSARCYVYLLHLNGCCIIVTVDNYYKTELYCLRN